MSDEDFEPVVKPEDIVRILNEFVTADPLAALRLVETRVACGQSIADHPSIVCDNTNGLHVGVLGLINGFLRPIGKTVYANYEGEGAQERLISFTLGSVPKQ